MALLTPPDPTEEVAQPALRPRSPTAEDPHPMIYTTCRGATPSPGAGSGAAGEAAGAVTVGSVSSRLPSSELGRRRGASGWGPFPSACSRTALVVISGVPSLSRPSLLTVGFSDGLSVLHRGRARQPQQRADRQSGECHRHDPAVHLDQPARHCGRWRVEHGLPRRHPGRPERRRCTRRSGGH